MKKRKSKARLILKTSLIFNILLGVGKILFGVFFDFFFCVSGIFNLFIFFSKKICYEELFINDSNNLKKNIKIAIYLFSAGLFYLLYMLRLIFKEESGRTYTFYIAIGIAFVSFFELGLALYGIIADKGQTRIYRNLKIINFCSALTAIMLTQIAILSFTGTTNVNQTNGFIGMGIGIIIMILSLYIYFAPSISLKDRSHQEFLINSDINEEINIPLKHSFIYGDYVYKGIISNGKISGDITKEKGGFLKIPIFFRVILIILSEILIFPFLLGRLIYFFRVISLPKKLENILKETYSCSINLQE